jgi:hypothetical protein
VSGRATRAQFIQRSFIGCGRWIAASAVALALAGAGCTHLFETNAERLPDRLDYPGFSFQGPDGGEWYMRDVPPESTLVQFRKHSDGVESMIQVARIWPPDLVENADELMNFASNLPGEDPQVTLEDGHGTTCVRYRARSALTVNYEGSDNPQMQQRMVTDEDSLECLDPLWPGALLSFTFSQRGKHGGSVDGAHEADAFIKSIQFEQYQAQQ